jgi:hypothetical protein
MSIYRIVGVLPTKAVVTRYMRADNAQAVRTRVYKAFQMRAYAIAQIARQALPEHIGTQGYDDACNARETFANTSGTMRTMQSHRGADNTGRAFYKPSEAQATRVNDKAQALLAMLRLAA